LGASADVKQLWKEQVSVRNITPLLEKRVAALIANAPGEEGTLEERRKKELGSRTLASRCSVDHNPYTKHVAECLTLSISWMVKSRKWRA
jgi:hypothetical protein